MSLSRGSGSFRRTLAPNADFAEQIMDTVRHGGHDRLATLIAEGGSDINLNAKDRTGASLLKWACYSGHWQCAELLLKNGASVNIRDNSGNTPLITSCAYGFPEVALLLIENGADIELKSRNGNTALIMAAAYGHVEAMTILMEHGADIESANMAGNTPLHVAGKNGQFETADMLMKHGASLTTKNTNGQTPYDLAFANNFVDLMELLREKREAAFNVRRSRFSRAAMREALAVYDYDGPVDGITDAHVAQFLDGVVTRITSLVSGPPAAMCSAPCTTMREVCARDGSKRLADAEEEWRMLPPTLPKPTGEKKRAQEEAVQRAISAITSPRPGDAPGADHSVLAAEAEAAA